MYRPGKLAVSVITLLSAFLTTACGSSSAFVRLVAALPSSSFSTVDLLVDGKTVASNVVYASGSAYVSVGSGSHHIQAEASGTTTVIADFGTQSFSSGSYNTAISTSAGPQFYKDDHTAPSSGNIKVRVINASAGLPTTDVYVLTAGSGISGSPTFASLGFPAASSYSAVAAGSYEIIFTQPGNTFAEYSTSAQSFSSGQVRTVVVLDGQVGTGGFTSSVLADLN